MDALDQVAAPAGELLARVDDLLARVGAPDDHPVWPLLRRVRALPSEAAGAVVALSAAPIEAVAGELRGHAATHEEARSALRVAVGWDGAAAEAFTAYRQDLCDHLASAADDLAAVADAAHDVAEWAVRARSRLATTLAEVIASAEAVAVVVGAPDAAHAAATIAVRVLATVDAIAADGESVLRTTAAAGGRLSSRRAAGPASFDRTVWIEL